LDDGKLKIECKSRQGIVSLAGLEINKITYSKAFSDVKIKDWFYIPVMELASRELYSARAMTCLSRRTI